MHIGNQQKTTALLYKYHIVLYLILIDLQKVTLIKHKQLHVYARDH